MLHALGLDPHACLPFVLSIDWEDDQWTFFKPPHEDLVTLYGGLWWGYQYNTSDVPEPASLALLAIGAIALKRTRRRADWDLADADRHVAHPDRRLRRRAVRHDHLAERAERPRHR